MPLDDREQQILDEIERQFYQEDPDLAHAVRNIDKTTRFGIRLPAVGAVAGIVSVLLFFTMNTAVALVGFLLLVVSATALVQAIQARRGTVEEEVAVPIENRQRMFRRFRRG
ncbi:MAG: DUF3040 domain-containing protein [Acidimicrobiia bacterium]|nr:DUF3040 domain-containing protein [Acidimicrobiia bacterium]MDH4308150.1 DUF3040 domain-containing protein [Acidimicrobiia bacterium]MDH5293337.1 DUF3040 domain-containing protein [Acidimicrobiia bacterium]